MYGWTRIEQDCVCRCACVVRRVGLGCGMRCASCGVVAVAMGAGLLGDAGPRVTRECAQVKAQGQGNVLAPSGARELQAFKSRVTRRKPETGESCGCTNA